MVKVTLFRSIILLSLVGFMVYLYALKHAGHELQSKENRPVKFLMDNIPAALTVSTVRPTLTNLSMAIPANGNIAAWQEALIGAEVSGLMLKEIFVNAGDVVKKGQLIAHFSDATIQADIEQALANVAEAKATNIEAAENAKRALSIEATGGLSGQQLSQYKSAQSVSAAKLRAAEAVLKSHQLKLMQTFVTAPDSGVISSRSATLGMVAVPGQELFRLIRQQRVEWRAELTSSDVSKIKANMLANLTLPDGHEVQGQVRAVAPNVDHQTRNAIVYVDLPNSTAKAGMYARGEFILTDSPALTLPATAINMIEGFAYVMQVDENKRIKPIKVTLGRRLRGQIEILDFKERHADYVLSGGAFLKEGDFVSVVANPAARVD